MDKIELPVCRWRREPCGPNRHSCISPLVHTGPNGLDDVKCLTCRFVDRPGPVRKTECVHLGELIGRRTLTEEGKGSRRLIPLEAYICRLHGVCQKEGIIGLEHYCPACPDLTPTWRRPTAGSVRHLMYFLYPLGDVWRWNVMQLRERMSLFNGERLITVATSDKTATPEQVFEALQGLDAEIRLIPNDAVMREMAGYLPMLKRLERWQGEGDATFYGHAKGVTSEAWSPCARRWTTAMYQCLLDYWPVVQRQLVDFPAVGIFRRVRRMPELGAGRWHYSGSFRWWRNKDLYKRNWQALGTNWVAGEVHIGQLFDLEESACLCGEFGSGNLGLYLEKTWALWAQEAVTTWKGEHEMDKERPLLMTCVIASHQKAKYVHEAIASVLAQTTPDWQLIVIDSGPLYDAGEFARYKNDHRILVTRSGEERLDTKNLNVQGWCHNQVLKQGRVRGDLVCFLSDDDVYSPIAFEQWLKAARARPEKNAWIAPMQVFNLDDDGKEHLVHTLPKHPVTSSIRELDCLADGAQVAVRTAYCPPWPEEKITQWHGDGLWLNAIGARFPIYGLFKVCGRHRHTALSTFTKRE